MTPAAPQCVAVYRPPLITMVRPVTNGAPGGTLPQDNPVIVFRFASSEAADSIDLKSVAVTAIGPKPQSISRALNVSSLGNTASGSLADPNGRELALGDYQVVARICSNRGACSSSRVTVSVVSTWATPADSATIATTKSQRSGLIGLLLGAVKKLFQR
jgi:hypothetical protein